MFLYWQDIFKNLKRRFEDNINFPCIGNIGLDLSSETRPKAIDKNEIFWGGKNEKEKGAKNTNI